MILGPFQHQIFPLPHPQLYRLQWIKVCSVSFGLNFANYDTSGCIPWLFDDSLCHFAHYHICFNVGIGYNSGSLHKRVVHTVLFPWGVYLSLSLPTATVPKSSAM